MKHRFFWADSSCVCAPTLEPSKALQWHAIFWCMYNKIMRSLHHNTMSDVTAQKSHYMSFVARERCGTERSIDSIFMRRVREWAACRWASSLRSRRKSFFKHLTGAESILPCLRVISTRPLFCTGVITLHFTQPVIPGMLWLCVWTTCGPVIRAAERDVLVHGRIYRKSEN